MLQLHSCYGLSCWLEEMDCVKCGTFNVENLQPGKAANCFAADVVWLLTIDLFVCQRCLDCLSGSVGSCSGLRPVARGSGVTSSLLPNCSHGNNRSGNHVWSCFYNLSCLSVLDQMPTVYYHKIIAARSNMWKWFEDSLAFWGSWLNITLNCLQRVNFFCCLLIA